MRELVAAQIFPDIFDRVEFWRIGRQQDKGGVIWNDQIETVMPARAVEEQRRMRAWRDGFTDLRKMFVHGVCVGVGHDDPSAHSTVRANGAEQIGPLVARIAHGARACPFSRPEPCQRPLLANAGFILEPDFDRLGLGLLWKALG